MAVSQIGEACKKQISAEMSGILSLVLPFFQDGHPRVINAAMQLIGVFCEDLSPDFQQNNHTTVVPAILSGLGSPHLRLKGQAAAVLVNFCEGSEDGVLDGHLDAVLGALVPALQVDCRPLQEDAVTALSLVATSSKAEFAKYYASFMPGLKAIIQGCNSKETRTLKGKALECMSLIGVAVSEGGHKALFEADGAELMNLILATLATNMEADDPLQDYVLITIPRVAQALKEGFVQYLPQVVPIFLKSLQGANPQDLFSMQDEDDIADDTQGTGVVSQVMGIRGVGKKRINVHVEALTEKMRSAEIICNLCCNLQEYFFPYVEQTTALMLPLLDFPLEEIRHSVMKVLPELMRSGTQHFEKMSNVAQRTQFAQATLRGMLPVVLTALVKENDTENCSMLLENFAETIQLADEGAMTPKEVDAMIQILRSLLNDCKERQRDILVGANDGDADEKDREDIEEELEVECELQEQIGECLGAVLRSSKGESVQPFDTHFRDALAGMMAPNNRKEDRQMALCAFIDVVEHGSPAPIALGYAGQAVPAMAAYTQDENADMRRTAAYGMGIMAQAAPEQFAPHAADAVKCLSAMVSSPATTEDEQCAVDNAVNALGRIALSVSAAVDANAITQAWLQKLPLQGDRYEAKSSIELLDKMITQQFAPLFADPAAATAKILQVLANGTTIEEEGTQWASNKTAKQAVAATLQHLQATVPADVLKEAYVKLPQKSQAALQAVTA
jgi:hypothetical protein